MEAKMAVLYNNSC